MTTTQPADERTEADGADGADTATAEAATSSAKPQVTVYRGTVEGHDYVVRARHGVMDTWATVIIDGVFHDPRRASEPRTDEVSVGTGAQEAAGGEVSGEADGLAFSAEDTVGKVVYAVRRPDEKGKLRIAERIRVSTAGFGGKGEVDVLGGAEGARMGGFYPTPLAPEKGSASWRREQRQLAHPMRFALISAAFTAAKYLIPLLGIGALFSGLLRPVREWVESLIRPPVEAIAELLRPVGEVIETILEPIGRALAWLRETLFGWIPEFSISLPFDVPPWVVDVGIPVVIVLLVFWMTLGRLKRRQSQLGVSEDSSSASDDEPGRASD